MAYSKEHEDRLLEYGYHAAADKISRGETGAAHDRRYIDEKLDLVKRGIRASGQ